MVRTAQVVFLYNQVVFNKGKCLVWEYWSSIENRLHRVIDIIVSRHLGAIAEYPAH